jgi:hypothetical protein
MRNLITTVKIFMVQVPASFPQGLGWQIETQDGGGGEGGFYFDFICSSIDLSN